jgi:hypothetical protein
MSRGDAAAVAASSTVTWPIGRRASLRRSAPTPTFLPYGDIEILATAAATRPLTDAQRLLVAAEAVGRVCPKVVRRPGAPPYRRLLLLPDGGEEAVLITNMDVAGGSTVCVNFPV